MFLSSPSDHERSPPLHAHNHLLPTLRSSNSTTTLGTNHELHQEGLQWIDPPIIRRGPDAEEVILSPSTPVSDGPNPVCSYKKSLLVKVVGAVDLDPTNKNVFMNKLRERMGTGPSRLTSSMLLPTSVLRRTPWPATTWYRSFLSIYSTGFAQYGKTR